MKSSMICVMAEKKLSNANHRSNQQDKIEKRDQRSDGVNITYLVHIITAARNHRYTFFLELLTYK